MTYEEASYFSLEQKRVASRIKRALRDAYKLGLIVLGKQDHLILIRSDIYKHSTMDFISGYLTPELDCGNITDCGADDQEYLEPGFIEEESK